MKAPSLLIALLSLFLTSCNHKQNNTAKSANDDKFDAANEETMMHPKFDENKIHGLGIFKIGTSVENSVGQLIGKPNYSFDSIWSREQEIEFDKKRDKFNYEIIKLILPPSSFDYDKMDGVGAYNEHALWCKNTTTYFVETYFIDSLVIRNVVLRYFNNSLVSIECNAPSELINAITFKFGDPAQNGGYSNGDVEVVFLNKDTAREEIKITIKGGTEFLRACSDKDYAVQNAIDKAQKTKNLKNL